VEPPSELAERYVLDTLDADDRESFEAHMRLCARCRREVADVREFVEMLRLAARGIDPLPLCAVANRPQ
jgi:anti-sigma factor RsiW